MTLPHYPSLQEVPAHLTTRAGLKRLGHGKWKPQLVATVTSYGKNVFLYDPRAVQDPAGGSQTARPATPQGTQTRSERIRRRIKKPDRDL
ncbi:hypothetical protein [Deinococcus roseus]|uniref:Uncharacterized protein n=1 Tax=Deinococcus roseus TaxID=392414 RepID=A0ABQ2D3I5_9DEIO|nr:hypothetical protein [Deinococcus roseus]GGJ44793.1 hypothetical protein GCM10008938_33760 [Deinococcus roseus]